MPLKRFMRSAVLGLAFLLSSCSPEKETPNIETLCLIDPINGLPTPLPTSFQDGLVLHRPFNTPPTESTGPTWNAYDGKYRDGALTFDGIDDKITIPNSKDFSIATTGQLTISFWARFDQTTFTGEGSLNEYLYFLAKGTTQFPEWAFRQYSSMSTEGRSNRVSLYIFNPGGGLGAGSYVQEPINTNEWVHLVGTVHGDTILLWKDGALKNTGNLHPYTIVPTPGPDPLTIGTRDGKSWFRGSIDELRIYNRVLHPSEIQTLFTAQSCNQYFK